MKLSRQKPAVPRKVGDLWILTIDDGEVDTTIRPTRLPREILERLKKEEAEMPPFEETPKPKRRRKSAKNGALRKR